MKGGKSLFSLLFFFAILSIILAEQPKHIKEHLNRKPEKPASLNDYRDDKHLDIHIIAHTHDDVGWLKTVDEYYYGANQSIQDAGVQYILDTVIQALQQNPERKFIYVEIGFFIRWWDQQTDFTKQIVRDLVREGRLEFINGGWCMNDEANTHYTAIIEQMTEGHLFLWNEFGVRPTIGWHIDPFGHANTQASLFAQMGFDAFFFGRIDWQDHNIRNQTQNLEFVWRGSNSLGATSDIFAHVLYTDYCYLSGFAFEWQDPPIQDDKRLFNVNIKERADTFVAEMRKRALSFRTDQVIQTFGCDFQFENAIINFKNMDKLMAYINSHPEYNVNMKYSTPSIYIKAVHAKGLTWSLNQYDFFPYADDAHSYWSGYFTSRPALKGYVRTSNNFLGSTQKLHASLGIQDDITTYEKIDTLTQAFSVAQHHDAVAGTEKQHVADDYAMRLSIGQSECEDVISSVLGKYISGSTGGPTFDFCPLINVSQCDPLLTLSTPGKVVPIIMYNPVGWARANHHVRLPVPTQNIKVTNNKGQSVPFDVFPNPDIPTLYTVAFSTNIPALGFTTYFLERTSKAAPVVHISPPGDNSLENTYLKLTFSTSGYLSSITNKVTGQTISLSQDYQYYNGSTGNNKDSSQPSGAYIFRPNRTETFPIGQPTTSFYRGNLVLEARQSWSSWVSQVVRLYMDSDHVEFEATVGPIDISDGLGKEVITRFSSSLQTNLTIYTDSEGQEMQKRVYNFRPTWKYVPTEPVAGNYYPINMAAYIKDTNKDMQFTIVTDRSHGGGSLAEGQMEHMLHRRLLQDDYRGVGEPLNETDAIRTSLIGIFNSASNSSNPLRTHGITHNFSPILIFGSTSGSSSQWIQKYKTNYSGLVAPLPSNVHILTFKKLYDGTVLLRLNHIYAIDEDPVLSKPAVVDLDNFFSDWRITSLTEMTLSANSPKSEMHRLKWKTSGGNTEEAATPKYKSVSASKIVLNAMEIRTFIVRLQRK